MLEASLSLFLIAATCLTLLQLCIDFVSFLSLEEQEFLVDQNRVEAGPTRLEGIVLAEVIIMLKFEVVLPLAVQLDVERLNLVVGARSGLLTRLIG